MFVAGLTSPPASIQIDVIDENDHSPMIELLETELRIINGVIHRPFVFIVHDGDSNHHSNNSVAISGDIASSFELNQMTRTMYNIKLIREVPEGKSDLFLIVIDNNDDKFTQKVKVTVNNFNKTTVFKFDQLKYDFMVNMSQLYYGNVIGSIGYEGKSEEVELILVGDDLKWVALNGDNLEIKQNLM